MDPATIPTSHSDAVIITWMVIGFLTTLSASVLTFLSQRGANQQHARKLEENTKISSETKDKVDENTKLTTETKEKATEAADTMKAVTETVLRGTGDGGTLKRD